jgi:phosphatidylserine/phosphatidylglycerophosphate/cardiolipin synthase-like enzyme
MWLGSPPGSIGMFLSRVAITLAAGVVLFSPLRSAAADRLCDASFENCRTPLLELIKNERSGIDVAFWFMEDARYSAAIIDRWKAGVPVRIIMDSRANVSYPHNVPVLKALADARIPMREKTSGGIVHWKTMIFAGQNVVEFSGANFSPHAFVPVTPYVDYCDEVIYTTDDPALVNSFKTRFDDVWTTTTGYRNYANGPATPTRRYPTFAIDARLNFPPYQDFANRSVKRYNAERLAIDALMYRITDRRHSDALIAARQRGVAVRLITEPQQYRDPKRLWHSWNIDRMYMAGIRIRHRAHAGWMHQKTTLLRGQQLAIFGSSNWTSPSASSQLEHNIFSTDFAFYRFFADVFERKWRNLAGKTETTSFVPLPPNTPSYVSPSDGATRQPLTVTLKWRAGYWAHKYDIYFGTSPTPPRIAANVELGPSTSSGDYKGYTVTNLRRGVTYYWKIVSKTMANQSKAGVIRSFRT